MVRTNLNFFLYGKLSRSLSRGPTHFENNRHPCMWDERIRRDLFQDFLLITQYSVSVEKDRTHNKQAVELLVSVSTPLLLEHLGLWPPIWRQRTTCILWLGHFPTEDWVIKKLRFPIKNVVLQWMNFITAFFFSRQEIFPSRSNSGILTTRMRSL